MAIARVTMMSSRSQQAMSMVDKQQATIHRSLETGLLRAAQSQTAVFPISTTDAGRK